MGQTDGSAKSIRKLKTEGDVEEDAEKSNRESEKSLMAHLLRNLTADIGPILFQPFQRGRKDLEAGGVHSVDNPGDARVFLIEVADLFAFCLGGEAVKRTALFI